MITRIAHIGIAVKDLKSASETYKVLLQSDPSEVEFVENQKVNVVHFQVGNSSIELLQGTSPDSPLTKFIEKYGEGIHHISFESEDIAKETERLKNAGLEPLYGTARHGSDNSLINFLHPSKTNGVLTEISQPK